MSGQVETAVISYRVADFLKRHPPFNAIDDADLLELAGRGRVRFYEPNEYVLWQGEPHRVHVFVIQQGTVSLWDDAGDASKLRDVRGPGDMLGVERYNGARHCLCTVRSESDVVVYGFPQADFDACVMKYSSAAQYVAAEGRVSADYQPTGQRRAPQRTFLHDLASLDEPETCRTTTSIREAARRILASSSDALAVVDEANRARAVVTVDGLLRWLAHGTGDVDQPVEAVVAGAPAVVAPDTSVAGAVLAMEDARVGALAITSTGDAEGALQAIVTSSDLGRLFGDQPSKIISGVRRAGSTAELAALNRRARAITLEYLTDAAAVEWLTRLCQIVDAAIVTRLLGMAGLDRAGVCWCVSGAAGRGESLPGVAPTLVAIAADAASSAAAEDGIARMSALLIECDYLVDVDRSFEPAFLAATVDEWRARYRAWIQDPVRQQMYLARGLFDLRAICGDRSLSSSVDAAVSGAVDRDFVHVLANDCLTSLPPLTFYQDAVIDRAGERHATFQLDRSALQPLVDVGRVFGVAGGTALGRSTLDRFEIARSLLPADEAIFREASDALKVVLWQQGRVGISQRTAGMELPPALLSRHDRHLLKGGFRAILRLIEFTGDRAWIERL